MILIVEDAQPIVNMYTQCVKTLQGLGMLDVSVKAVDMCHDYAQKGVGLCLLSSIPLYLVSSSRTFQNTLQ